MDDFSERNLSAVGISSAALATGIATLPTWGLAKPAQFLRPGGGTTTSVARRVSVWLGRQSPKLMRSLLRKAIRSEARVIKITIKTRGKAAVLGRYAAPAFLVYEAGQSTLAGIDAMKQPQIDDELPGVSAPLVVLRRANGGAASGPAP